MKILVCINTDGLNNNFIKKGHVYEHVESEASPTSAQIVIRVDNIYRVYFESRFRPLQHFLDRRII